MSNEKEAFAAWLAENFEPHDKATTYGLAVVEEAWSAALAWAATQQAPAAFKLEGANCVEFARCDYHDGPEWTPLYANPAPAECAAPHEREQTLRDALALLRCPEWAERVRDEYAAEFDQFVAGVLRRARPTGEANAKG